MEYRTRWEHKNFDDMDTLSLPVDNSRIHIRGREIRQTGNPSDEFPVQVRIRDEKVI